MRVLVVGGAGYVGGTLVDLLAYKGDTPWVYDNLTYADDYMKNVGFTFGDIRDRKKLKKWLDWADAVVWLAALVGDAACAIDPVLTKELNQDSVKWLSENFDGRIVFMSTCSVYGAQDGVLTEKSPTNPLSLYASTKLAAEDYLKDKNAVIYRLGTLFGVGGQHGRVRLDLVVNTLMAKATHDHKITVFGGKQYRPLLHVHDAATAIIEALDGDFKGTFNLHTENLTIIQLAKKVQKQVKCELEIVDQSFEDSRNYRVSSAKAKKTFGFDPFCSVDFGIQQFASTFEQGRIKDPLNPRYNNYAYLSR